MPGVVVAGAIAGAGAIGGAAIGASAQKKAAKKAVQAQQYATDQNNALAREEYAKNEAHLSPFIERGNEAGGVINSALGIGDTAPAENAFRKYIDTSDYAFQENQGERGLAAKLSAAGGVESGAARKAEQQFRTNLQSGYRGQWLGALGTQQGTGASSAASLAGVSNAFVNAVTNNNQQLADTSGNAALVRGAANAGIGSAIGNAFGTIAGSIYSGGGFGGSFGTKTPSGGPFTYFNRPTQAGSWI